VSKLPDATDVDLSFLQGGGQMGALIRAHDWTSTDLGPPILWPQSLRLTVQLMLNTGHPMYVWWGPHLTCLYNDAYSLSIGPERHPVSLGKRGREVWEEIWAIIGPQIEQVMEGRGATWHQNALVPITRGGQREDVYWTYSYSPIRETAAPHGVGGVLVVCSETTQAVLAEKRLQDENERQRALFEQAPSFMCVLAGPQHVFEFVNAAHRYLFNSHDWVGKPIREAFPDIAGQRFYELLDEVRSTGERVVLADQPVKFRALEAHTYQTRLLDFIYEPIRDGAGEVTGIFCEGFDVTERHRATEALRIREEQLRLATEAAEVALWDLDLVEDKLFWPERVKAMFGISPNVDVSMRDFYEGVHPNDRTRVTAAFARAADSQTRALYDVEYRTVGKEDGLIRWIAAKGRGIFNDDGTCVRVIGTVVDITKRKGTELQLKQLNETLERRVAEALAERRVMAELVETTDAFIQVADQHFRWLAINKASADEFERIFGVRPKVGDSMLDVLSGKPEHQQAVKAVWQRALNGESFTEIGKFGDASLDERIYEMRFNPLLDTSGKQIGAYQFVYDVTDRLREQARLAHAEEQLRQSQKMEAVGQLTGGLAHDFNNLLLAISGSLELLQKRLAAGRYVGIERYIDAAQSASRRAAGLTQRLLAFSRRQTLDPRAIDANKLIASMGDLIRRTVGPEVTVEIVGAGGLWMTRADNSQLENAVLNLAINGRDAMAPAGGRLTIETANKWLDEHAAAERELPPGQYISICVTDTGTGMSPDTAARIFDPFFTTKPLGEGTGLGLSMVHGFVRQSGGQVRVYSELGQGTTMCLYLPRFVGEADSVDVIPPHAYHRGAGESILVVDDEPFVRMLATEMLNEQGYTVIEASDGPGALRILQSDVRVDVLVTDVGLPGGLNGRQVADAALVSHPELKVLFITGYAENAVVGNGMLKPGMAVLTKPFAMAALATKVRDMIDGIGRM
jgi:PAS domain S-box-containing protein